MASIPIEWLIRCKPSLEKTVHQIAYKHRLPWYIETLKSGGLSGIEEAVNAGRYDERLGPPFEQQAVRWIEEGIESKREQLQSSASGGELAEPSDFQIRLALTTFSVDELRELIEKFGRQDLDALRAYLDANKESLKRYLGEAKLSGILGRATHRGIILLFSQPRRMTEITQAMWAGHYHDLFKQLNIERAVRGTAEPTKGRSFAEFSSPRNLAKNLGTTPYKVKKMLERLEQTPFEEFDGDYCDYLFWATDPAAYRHHLRVRNANLRPQRDPDPYFSQNN